MNDYSGIFLRDRLGEANTLPRPGGDVTASPDVISSGTTPVGDPQVAYGDTYSEKVGKDLTYGETNYIYVRGKNYASGQVTAKAALYWCYAAQIDNPDTWQSLTTADGSNSSPLAAAKGGVAVTDDPFAWAPVPPSPGNPYVLVVAVSDPKNPNPVPAYRKAQPRKPFAEWQASKGGVAALRLVEPPPPPPVKATYAFDGLLALDNVEQAKLKILLEVSGGVAGDHIACDFDAPDVDGNPIGIGSTKLSRPSADVGTDAIVAAEYKSRFTFTYATQSASDLPHPKVTLQIVTTLEAGDDDGRGGDQGKVKVLAQYTMTTSVPT